MSFYGGNQNGGQPGGGQQQQMGRQPTNPGLPNVQQVLTPQLFNINVNPNQLHNFFNEHNSSQNTLQLNAAANASSILLQQQPQSFPVNLINEQLGVGVGQLISSATVTQSQMQGLPISMPSALSFPQTLQVHTQTPPPQQSQSQNQQSKQKVFTGTVTKTHDNFGFIDEEVFFQMGVVKGPILPKEGDRVLVEADFNASMPFKWNATRVQIVNMGGSLNSSLNSMSNMNTSHTSQAQHMGFNTVGMQKQTSAPSQPVLTSQANPTRLHGAQPVTIVSNPHSVYSGATSGRIRPPNVGAVVPPPVTPMVSNQQRDPKRSMGMPLPPEPPNFAGNSSVSGIMSSDREHREMDRERCRENERSRDRARDRSRERSRERMRERSRERVRPRSRERSRDRGRDRSREKIPRIRSRSRERVPRDRSPRDRSPDRKVPVSRDRSRERVERTPRDTDRSVDRTHSTRRSRSRERSRDRGVRPREKSKIEQPLPEKPKERERSRERREKDGGSKNGKDTGQTSTPSSQHSSSSAAKSNKEESKVDTNKAKEKDRKPAERVKPAHPAPTDRSKRSRSRESVRTDKGRSTSERSRSRSSSPKRKSLRPPPRYAVELPKFSLDTKDITVKELQRRYPNLYIPSDFFLAKSTWMETFPLYSPFELGHPCPVQIMRKGVLKIEVSDPEGLENKFKDIPDILEPTDASYIFKAKVMIPSMSNLETIYRKSCGVNESGTEIPDNTQHIDRLINFIVGMKTSKHEVMALGGPWSPSLDGNNPQSESQTLINTAIRCVRALTGVNLSGCKHWYRFMELYYKRSNCLETVVYFLPDVWSCLPGTKEWSTLKSMYKFALHGEKADPMKKMETTADNINADTEKADEHPSVDSKLEKDGKSNGPPSIIEAAPTTDVTTDLGKDSSIADGGGSRETDLTMDGEDNESINCSGVLVIDEVGSPSRDDGGGEHQLKASNLSSNTVDENGEVLLENTEEQPEAMVVETNQDDLVTVEGELSKDCKETTAEEEPGASTEENTVEPAARLNPRSLNVAQLRGELGKRHLSPKGLKSVLITRLAKALKEEEEMEIQGSQKEILNVNVNETVKEEGTTATSNTEKLSESDGVHRLETEKPDKSGDKKASVEVKVDGDENCIRLVNPSSILEDQDDDISVEDGEVKDDPDSALMCAPSTKEFGFLSKFPLDTFPIIKPGMKEEEIKMWERRYALPKNPRLLIFPSESAKGGNFDCISMTLEGLRDYRIIDKKEDNFEVSLFSEFFHEMLQRDFAFKIYKEIVIEAGKEESVTQQQQENKSSPDAGEPASKKRKLSSNAVANPSAVAVSSGKKITDPYLLLSFIFFDVTRCGYVTESDLEDLCNCIGVGLTRAQIRKIVQKVLHKGNLYYRKWTDRPEQSKTTLSVEEAKTLAQGNHAGFPVFVLQDGKAESKTGNENEANGEAVIAQVNGKNIDVKKLMEELNQHERSLAVAESSLNVMKNSLEESKGQVSELKKSNESLKEEVTKTKEALKKAETAEKSAKESVDTFKRASERFCDRIKDLVKFPTTTSSSGAAKEKTEAETVTKEVTNNLTEH